jgi:putative ABC transport system substrate-binding protein
VIAARRNLILSLAASLAAPGLLGQTAKTLPRVSVIFNGTRQSNGAIADAFVLAMRGHGYVDGRDVVLDLRFADARNDRLAEIIAEALRGKPAVLVVAGSHAVWEAKKATAVVPIVMATVADPVAQGLVASLARPGGNITGIANLFEVVDLKRMELARELFPTARRLGYLRNPSNPFARFSAPQSEAVAKRLGVELLPFDATNSAELKSALAAIAEKRPDVLLVGSDALLLNLRGMIVEALALSRVPAIYASRSSAAEGGLVSLSPAALESYPKAAGHVARILQGARPADLPIEQPTKFDLVVNLKTARSLGVTIPQAVLLRADQVID